MYIFWDFNSRSRADDVFIKGIDNAIDCEVIDFSFSKYGDLLIDFLVNVNMCMLNGLVCNDFTKGSSVVDFWFVNHDCFDKLKKSIVLRVADLIDKANLVSIIASPDYSLLMLDIILDSEIM